MTILTYLFLQLSYATDLEKGDQFYQQREELSNVYRAVKLYKNELSKNNNNIEALWRLSMAHYYIGHVLDSSNERINHYRKGIEYGKTCAQISKRKRVECIFWLGTNTALLNKEHGIFSLAFGIGHMINLFEESKVLDPNYASSGPYRMLALLYHKAPGFLGGDEKKAIEYIKLARKNSPNEPLNYYFHIKILLDLKKQKEAMELANNFQKKANPEKFKFYESHSAFNKIKYFAANKRFQKND